MGPDIPLFQEEPKNLNAYKNCGTKRARGVGRHSQDHCVVCPCSREAGVPVRTKHLTQPRLQGPQPWPQRVLTPHLAFAKCPARDWAGSGQMQSTLRCDQTPRPPTQGPLDLTPLPSLRQEPARTVGGHCHAPQTHPDSEARVCPTSCQMVQRAEHSRPAGLRPPCQPPPSPGVSPPQRRGRGRAS